MMDGRRAIKDWLEDIVHWGERLARHISGMTREQFMLDEKTQDASAKCAEAIGEAAGEILRIEPDFDSRNPELQLKAAHKSRNRLSRGPLAALEYDRHVCAGYANRSKADSRNQSVAIRSQAK